MLVRVLILGLARLRECGEEGDEGDEGDKEARGERITNAQCPMPNPP